VASPDWSPVALKELAALVTWVDANRGGDVTAAVVAVIDRAVRAAAARPLAYPWGGAVLPTLARAERSYRRVLVWDRRLQVFYRYDADKERILVLHVRGSRQRPLSFRMLTMPSRRGPSSSLPGAGSPPS
jgi:plasmid stabilization system protein ParE